MASSSRSWTRSFRWKPGATPSPTWNPAAPSEKWSFASRTISLRRVLSGNSATILLEGQYEHAPAVAPWIEDRVEQCADEKRRCRRDEIGLPAAWARHRSAGYLPQPSGCGTRQLVSPARRRHRDETPRHRLRQPGYWRVGR